MVTAFAILAMFSQEVIINEDRFCFRESSYVQWMAATMYSIKLQVEIQHKYLSRAKNGSTLALWGQIGFPSFVFVELICNWHLCMITNNPRALALWPLLVTFWKWKTRSVSAAQPYMERILFWGLYIGRVSSAHCPPQFTKKYYLRMDVAPWG